MKEKRLIHLPIALAMVFASLPALLRAESIAPLLAKAKEVLSNRNCGYVDAMPVIRRLEPCLAKELPPKEKTELAWRLADLYEKAFLYQNARAALARIQDDTSLPTPERCEAFLKGADLLSIDLKRTKAVALLDKALEMDHLTPKYISRLLLARGRTLLTPATFEEVATKENIDEATRTIEKALKVPGLTAEERFQAQASLVDAYRDAGFTAESIALSEKYMKAPGLNADQRYFFLRSNGDSYFKQKNYKKALSTYERAYDVSRERSTIHRPEALRKIGWTARILRDWSRAQQAYSDLLPLMSKDNDPVEYQGVANILSTLTTVTRKELKTATAEEVFGEENEDLLDLDLDE